MAKETKKNQKLNEIIMKIATEFINVPVDQFSAKINESLSIIGSFLNVDRAYVFEYVFEKNIANNTYEWCNEGVQPQIEFLQNFPLGGMIDDVVFFHKQGREVIFEDVSKLDQQSEIYKALSPQGIKSICTIPLMYKDECVGFVGFDDIRVNRRWTQFELNLLLILSELIINAIYKHRNDEMLIDLKTNAQKASEAKGQFLTQMSHEIRTPLNGIQSALYLLKNTMHTEEQKRYLEIGQTSLDILSTLINRILDFSKIEAGKMEMNYRAVDLEVEIVRTIKTLRPAIIQKNLQCFFEYDYSIDHEILCDINKINQIILNLSSNAIKYTDVGFVKTKVSTQRNDDKNYIIISIQDTGRGISDEDQTKIFDAFYRTKNGNNVQGTGLGLRIVWELVHLMNGELTLKSELGKGSTFEVKLPFINGVKLHYEQPFDQNVLLLSGDPTHEGFYFNLLKSLYLEVDKKPLCIPKSYSFIFVDDAFIKRSDAKTIIMQSKLDSTKVIMFSKQMVNSKHVDVSFDVPISRKMLLEWLNVEKKTMNTQNVSHDMFEGEILIVDDNEINGEALNSILMKKGFHCDIARNGFEAIEMVRQKSYQMIMMDIQMPQMDGYETSKIIREINSNKKKVPIVVITANVFLSDYDIKMSPYIDDILYKPLDLEALNRILKKHIRTDRSIKIPKQLHVFNRKVFNNIFDQNMISGIKMAERFLSDYNQDMDVLYGLMKTNESDLLHKKLHYIKGLLGYLGAERFMFLLAELMNKVQIHKAINEHHKKQLIEEGQQFVVQLRNFIMENKE